MISQRFSPFLTPEELGIDLEEDSLDVTEEQVAGAVDTDNQDDFVAKVKGYLRPDTTEGVSTALRRKGGILYCRLVVGAEMVFFKVEWLRNQ